MTNSNSAGIGEWRARNRIPSAPVSNMSALLCCCCRSLPPTRYRRALAFWRTMPPVSALGPRTVPFSLGGAPPSGPHDPCAPRSRPWVADHGCVERGEHADRGGNVSHRLEYLEPG